METEFKLNVAADDIQRVMRQARLKGLVAGRPSSQRVVSHYLDSDGLDLHENDLSLRVRTEGKKVLQTLKSGGKDSAGVSERGEWEMQVAGPDPDIALLRHADGVPSKAAALLKNLDRKGALHELFVTDVKRTTWTLQLGESQVEMALDQGEVRCGDARLPVSELEFELQSGSKDALFEVAREVAANAPVLPAERSKGTRGYALASGEHPCPVRAQRISLAPGLSVDDGIKLILGDCLLHALSNVRGILEDDDPEYVHQMRVGLRRFRSACKLFSSWVELPAPIESELEWIGGLLGSARDHDVLAQSTLPGIRDGLGGDGDLQPLLERAGAAAAEQRAILRRALHSPRFGQWMVALLEWIDRRRWHDGLDADATGRLETPLARFARKAVARGHARIERRGKKMDPCDNARMHRLRIACKRQRYAVEFFRDVERGASSGRYIKQVTGLQDLIGARVDLAVARRLVRELGQGAPELAEAAALASGFLACRASGELRGVRREWKALAARSPAGLFHAKGK